MPHQQNSDHQPSTVTTPVTKAIVKSKTKRKQEMLALQQLGVKLCQLTTTQLTGMSLPSNLLAAILEAKRLKSNGAIRRQAQYIGKIMRQVDSASIATAYHNILQHHQVD